jgi:hypothetical protein
MRKLLLVLPLLVAAAFGQVNTRYDNVALGPKGPIPNALVAVCTQPANTSSTPCTPKANLCSSLTDTACISPNPVTADALGNYHFYIQLAEEPFTVMLYGSSVASPFVMADQYGPTPGSGTFAAGGDLTGTSTNQHVVGLDSVPFCTGFAPTNGQVTQYTTASSPNPCWGAGNATGAPPATPSLSIQGSNSGATAFVGIPGTLYNTTNGLTKLQIFGPDPWIDPTAPGYGATGNGSTDDSTAINNAIAAAAGNTVFLPCGTYLFTASQMNIANAVTIQGESKQCVTLKKGGNFDLVYVNAADVTITGVTIVGQSATYSGKGITLNSTAQRVSIVDNVIQDNAASAIYGTSATQVLIDRNFIYGSAAGGGIFMENNTTHVNVTNNYIDGSLWTATNNKDISLHSTSTGKQVSSIIVSHNNMVVGANGMAMEILPGGLSGSNYPLYPTDIVVSDNTCYIVANAEECYSLSGMNNSTITGNIADVNGFLLSIACFEVVGLNDSTFTGNTCADDIGGSAMSFQGVAFDTITGNHIDTFKSSNGNGFYFALPQASNAITSCSASASTMTFNFSGTLNGNIWQGGYIYVTGTTPTTYNTPSGVLWRVLSVSASSLTAQNFVTSSLGGNCTGFGTIGLGTVGNTVTGNEIFYPPVAAGTLYGMNFDCSSHAGTSCSGNTIANNEFVGTGYSGEYGIYIATTTGGQADSNNIGTNSFRNLGEAIQIGNAGGGNTPTNTFIAPQMMSSVTTPLGTVAGTIAESFLPTIFGHLASCASGLQGNYAFVTDSTTNTNGATITGSGSNAVSAVCNGSNWVVTSGTGSGGGGGGTGTQYQTAYYNPANTGVGGGPGIIGQTWTSDGTSGPPAMLSPGLADSTNSPVSSTPYTIACDSGTSIIDRARMLRFTSGASVVTIPLSTGSGCPNLVFSGLNISGGSLTVNATSTDTFTVLGGTGTQGASQTSATVPNYAWFTINQGASGIWEVRINGGNNLNGAAVPTNLTVASTNGNSQLVQTYANQVEGLFQCTDTSGSGATQTCTTNPNFSVSNASCVIYETTTANTGTSLTVNVNSVGAIAVAVPSSSGYTTTLSTSPHSIPAQSQMLMCYNSTNWLVMGNGVAGTGNGTVTTTGSPASPQIAAFSGASSITTATGHNITTPLACSDTSGSSTAQSCTTSPSFTPAAGDSIIYTTTTSNSGTGLTINVNSLGAKSVAKWQNSTTLAANDVRAGSYTKLTYDGTNWEIDTIGNAPSGGGSGAASTVIPVAKTSSYSLSSSDFQSATTTSVEALQFTISSATVVTATLPSSAPAQVSSQNPCVWIENSATSAPYELQINTNSLTLDGTAYGANKVGVDPGSAVEICSNGSNYLVSGGTLAIFQTYYAQGNNSNGQAFAPSGANHIIVSGFSLAKTTVVSHIYLDVDVDDSGGSNDYSWGIYSTGGSALCTTAATLLASGGVVTGTQAACSQNSGTVVLPAGTYILAATGNCTVSCTATFYTLGTGITPYSSTTTSTTSSGGALPSSITPPSAGTSLLSLGGMMMVLD